MIKALFVCSQNRLRSPTAEATFSNRSGLAVCSAGTNGAADNPISADLVEWADILFVMEAVHRRRINQMFGSLLHNKKIVVLDIPDEYEYIDPALVTLLENKVAPHLRLGRSQGAL